MSAPLPEVTAEPPGLPPSAGVVIAGAGFAGLATAYSLWRRGVTDLLVLEQEPVFAFHSSGRNAAILRRLIEEETTLTLALAAYPRLLALEAEAGEPLLSRTGGVLIGDAEFLNKLETFAALAPTLEATRLRREEVVARVPALEGADFAGGLLVPGDGVVDIHGLARALLAPVRHRFAPNARVIGLETHRGRVSAVETTRGTIATEHLVIAGGFASNALAGLAGLAPLPFLPVRRHLFVTAETHAVARGAPWVWNGSAGYYFRREGAGLLLCACDQTPWGESQPMDPPVDPAAREALAVKYTAAVPALAEVRPTRAWAGLRVLTPDQRFVIGRDPRLEGLSWVAGLGGHGMTTACAVGELGADAVLGLDTPTPLSPARFFGPEQA